MKAIILAAGMGKRLLPLTKDRPKPMVELLGRTLLEKTMDALVRKKVSEIIIVVGYCKDKIISAFGDSYKTVKITYVHNDDYYKTNNVYSLKLGLEKVHDDLILCEGDVVFEPEILDAIDEDAAKNLAFVSRYRSYMSGTVIKYDESTKRITELITKASQGKSFDYSDAYKTINIYYLTAKFLKEKFKPVLELYLSSEGTSAYYELLLGVLLYMNKQDLYAYDVEDIKWFEIDDINDLEMAETVFSDNKLGSIDKLHGGYWRYDFLDFSYIYNAYFPSKIFYSKLSYDLPMLIGNYPSGQEKICKLLSTWHTEDTFNPDNLIVGNGASELIRIINKTIVEKITIPIPTFNEYENKLPEDMINYFKLPAGAGFRLIREDFVKSVKDSKSNVALIINPNNPTGVAVDRQDLIWILEQLKGVFVIVDESFIDFTGERDKYSVQDLIDKYTSLVIIRSLSKEFGIAGLRLGYLLTENKPVKDKIKEYLPIWNINSIAEYFIEHFCDYKDSYDESMKNMIDSRDGLYRDLKSISYLEVLPSSAIFFLCKVKGSAKELKQKLFDKFNILIKDCSNKKLLENENYVRISVKTKEYNKKLIEALKQIDHMGQGCA